jgi:hypothetical protein
MSPAIQDREWRLRQATHASFGHTLNHRQVFASSGKAACFDTRNADAEIISTDRIGCLFLESGETSWVYRVDNATPFGPGVGAVSCHPLLDRAIFIHGLRDCDATKPYGATRRFGALLDTQHSTQTVRHAEARCVDLDPPFGALRGGTHAYSWSADGRAISFTYNDARVEERYHAGIGPPDLRTVGVMWTDHPVEVAVHDSGNFSGACRAMIVASVNHVLKPGTDTIESAREECFLGASSLAVAFIGRVRTRCGDAIDEVFVARWPQNAPSMNPSDSVDEDGRLLPPECVHVARVTRSENQKYPGVQGPRAWLIASPDGRTVYCPMRDDAGIVQVASVDVLTGETDWITRLKVSLASPLAIDRTGTQISLMSDGRIGILDPMSREMHWSPDWRDKVEFSWGAYHFLPDRSGLLFHGYPRNSQARWQQLWTATLH